MRKHAVLALAVCSLLLPHAFGQSVISARSGLVNFFEGVVFLDGQPLARKPGIFARLREGSTLLTESGRAEVLLTPDTYLRIGEKSSIRMISDDIADTRVELLAGSSIVDSEKAPAGAFVKIVFRDKTVRLLKPGHYRIDADPPQLRVFEGEAEVGGAAGGPVKIAASQLMPLDGAPVVKRFTQGSDGLLDLWSAERGALIASNMVNSQSIMDPLLDNGPGVPADLTSYIGYMPMATLPVYGLSTFGYGVGSPYLYSSFLYPSFLYPSWRPPVFVGFPAASLYTRQYRYAPVLSGRPSVYGGIRYTPTAPRTIFVPRPVTPVRPVSPGPRYGGVTAGRPVGRR